MLAQVRRRDHRRAHRGRRQVDGPDPRGRVLRRRILVHVGAGRLEHQVGLLGLRQQPVDAFVGGLQTQLAGPRQALAFRVDPDHPARFQPVRSQQFVQQVGADVSRPDNGHTCLRRHVNAPGIWTNSKVIRDYSNDNRTEPSPAKSATNSSPARASIARVHDPGNTMSPFRSRTPKLSTLRANHATAVTGLPSTASLRPSATTSPLRVSTASIDLTSTSRRRHPGLTQHEARRRGVVGDGVAQRDLPVGDPGVDQLDRRDQGLGGRQHVVLGATGSRQVGGQDETDFDLHPRHADSGPP